MKYYLNISIAILFSCSPKQESTQTAADSVVVSKTKDTLQKTPDTSNGSGYGEVDDPSLEDSKDPAIHQVEVPDEVPSSVLRFVPDGYKVLTIKEGDLNLDAFSDMIVVLKKKREDTINSYEPDRPLLVLIAESDGNLKLAGRNDNTVLCYHCGGIYGDPFSGISIKNGYFSVEHYGGSNWRWARIVTYKYSKEEKKWFLSRDGSESYHTSDPDKVETKIKTTKDFGKVEFTEFDIHKE